MIWSTSVLSNLSSDTEPTILVNFEDGKYIFNTGENTNRSFLQSKQNWKRAKAIFLTGVDGRRASGLTSLLMSLSDAAISSLSVIGPSGLTHFIAGMRSFTFRETMPVTPIETPTEVNLSAIPTPVYKDANASVYAIPIVPSASSSCGSSRDTASAGEERPKRKREWTPEDSPNKRRGTSSRSRSPRPDATLSELMKNQDFEPESLRAGLAQEYRRLVVSGMFGVSAKTIVNGKKGADLCEADNIDNYWQRPPLPRGFLQRLPRFSTEATGDAHGSTTAYVILGPRFRGKFNAGRAQELGVPHGRLRGRLAKGETITFDVVGEDGKTVERTVRPEECVGESQVPGVVMILDIPTMQHIPSLGSAFAVSSFYSRLRSRREEDAKEFNVRTVYHILGDGVLEHEDYKQFIEGFKEDVHHIVSSPEHSSDPITFTSAGFHLLRMHQLDPSIFPIPKYSLTPAKKLSDVPSLPLNTHLLQSDLQTRMRPPGPPSIEREIQKLDSFHPYVSAAEAGEMLLPDAMKDKFRDAQRDVKAKEVERQKERLGEPGDDVLVIPLGTGSSLPTKYRNVLSTLIQIPNRGNILLDCGEGSWGQLVRHFGQDEARDVLRDLRCIFISHIHADHHLGLAKVLAKRRSLGPLPEEPLYIIAPRQIHLYLREWSDIFDLGIEDDATGNGVKSIMSEALHYRRLQSYLQVGRWKIGGDEMWTDIKQSRRFERDLCRSLGLKEVVTVDVEHRVRCYGVVLKHQEGWSIVFSGDTKPCQNLVTHGRGATLLIHEASMADEEAEIAASKSHSTVGQAVDIGTRMGAKNILLTHFSARYPKMPPPTTSSSSGDDGDERKPVVALAFDLARLRIGDMWKLGVYVDAMKECVDEEDEDEDDG